MTMFLNHTTVPGRDQLPSWRSWLARQSHNLKVVSSSLTEGTFCVLNVKGLALTGAGK